MPFGFGNLINYKYQQVLTCTQDQQDPLLTSREALCKNVRLKN